MTLKQLISERGLSPENIETVETQMDCEMTLLGTVKDGLQKSEVWQSENFWGIGLWSAGSSILTSEQVDDAKREMEADDIRINARYQLDNPNIASEESN